MQDLSHTHTHTHTQFKYSVLVARRVKLLEVIYLYHALLLVSVNLLLVLATPLMVDKTTSVSILCNVFVCAKSTNNGRAER